MNVNRKFSNWDELDFLFNRAKWKIEKKKKIKKIKEQNFYEILILFSSLDIEYSFYGTSKDNIKNNSFLDNFSSEDFICLRDKNIKKQLIEELIARKFQYSLFNGRNLIMKDNHIIELQFDKNFNFFKKSKIIILNEVEFKIFFKISKKIKKLSFREPKYYLDLTKYNIKFIFLKFKNTFFPYVSKKEFLSLNIEELNSKSWLLRKKHLDIVTNNKTNIKVKDIINHFYESSNFTKAIDNIVETNTSMIFEEPIYANKDFWLNGNNFFIYNIIYQFRKNVVAYKDANEYIKDTRNKNLLYTKEYYESLKILNDNELKKFLKENPIEISKNSIVSGKHKAFAMIGRLINGKKYIKFKVRYIK